MFLQDKLADFDVFLERPIYMNYPNYPFDQRTCGYYNELRHAQDLFIALTKLRYLKY